MPLSNTLINCVLMYVRVLCAWPGVLYTAYVHVQHLCIWYTLLSCALRLVLIGFGSDVI